MNVARDERVDAALVAAGWQVVRVWEHETADEAAARVEAALRKEPAEANHTSPS